MKSIDLKSTFNFTSVLNFEKYLFDENYVLLNALEENKFSYLFDKISILDTIFFDLNNIIFKPFFKFEKII